MKSRKKYHEPRNKKGQVWYTDFMVGVLMFSLVVTTYFYYVQTDASKDENLNNFLLTEAKTISTYLIGSGYPQGWTLLNVSTVGLTDGNYRINNTKLSNFNSWNYEERSSYIHTTKDYYFYLQYMNGTKYDELCEDSPTCTAWNSSNQLIQNTRILIHNGNIVKMHLYIYQK